MNIINSIALTIISIILSIVITLLFFTGLVPGIITFGILVLFASITIMVWLFRLLKFCIDTCFIESFLLIIFYIVFIASIFVLITSILLMFIGLI